MTSNEDKNLLFSDRLCLIIIGDLQKLVRLSQTISDYFGQTVSGCVIPDISVAEIGEVLVFWLLYSVD